METFFATHAQQYFQDQLSTESNPEFQKAIGHVVGSIKRSIKFRLPKNGSLIANFENRYLYAVEDFLSGQLRLPFETILLETAHQSEEEGRSFDEILVASQAPEERDGRSGISVQSIIRRNDAADNHWVASDFFALIYYDTGSLEVGVFKIKGPDRLFKSPGEGYDKFLNSCAKTVLEFLSALACSNSVMADAANNRTRLNKKRDSKGKPPFYSYKVLKISQVSASVSGEVASRHQSPRVHLRRGHIRRLPNKTIWVNAAVVGDKSKGFVAKDYAVAAQA